MQSLLKLLFWIALPLTIAGWWQKDNFVPHIVTPPALNEDPVQREVSEQPFKVAYNDTGYVVQPRHEYDLTGMVVSYRYHDGDRMLHQIWNDHLNVADVCVVWGRNAHELDLNLFDFFNGQFTCNISTHDRVAWNQFQMRELSNNHLVSDDPLLRDRITSLKVGDIIRVRGWLSHYGLEGSPHMRKTSVTREDTGNGACETIFVREFEVLRSMPNRWRDVFGLAGTVLLLVCGVWLWGTGTGKFSHRAA